MHWAGVNSIEVLIFACSAWHKELWGIANVLHKFGIVQTMDASASCTFGGYSCQSIWAFVCSFCFWHVTLFAQTRFKRMGTCAWFREVWTWELVNWTAAEQMALWESLRLSILATFKASLCMTLLRILADWHRQAFACNSFLGLFSWRIASINPMEEHLQQFTK